MPSSVNINGLRIYRPGVYGKPRISSLGGVGISTGNVAVVGQFPIFEQGVPLTFSSPEGVADFVLANPELRDIAKMAFNPADDDRVAGAASLTFLNVAENTQASYMLKDESGADVFELKSKRWGPLGNRLWVKVNTNEDNENAIDIELGMPGQDPETYTGLTSGTIAELYYDGASLSVVEASINESEWKIAWELAASFTAPGGAQTLEPDISDVVVDGTVSIELSVAAAQDVDILWQGRKKDGAAIGGTKTIPAGDTGPVFLEEGASSVELGELGALSFETDDAAYEGTVTAKANAFLVNAQEYATVGDILAHIDQASPRGFHADALSPNVYAMTIEQDDPVGVINPFEDEDIKGPAKAELKADTWAVRAALANSDLVELEDLGADYTGAPISHFGQDPATSEESYFVGGTYVAMTNDNWTTQLEEILRSDIQVVVPWSTTIAHQRAVREHCKDASVYNRHRNAWCPSLKNLTLTQVHEQYSRVLNSRHCAVVADEVNIDSSSVGTIWYDARMHAVIAAGTQAGMKPGYTLTRKRPAINGTRQKWNPGKDGDVNDAISKSISVLTLGDNGWQFERSINTWQTYEEHPLQEVSANVSFNTSMRDLAANFEERIAADEVPAGSGKNYVGLAISILKRQVADGIIKAFRNVSVQDLGDRFRIVYEVAPIEPTNFFTLEARPYRQAA